MSSRFVALTLRLSFSRSDKKPLGNPGFLAQLVLRPAEFQPTFPDALAYACHSLLSLSGAIPDTHEIRREEQSTGSSARFQPGSHA